MFSSLKQRLLLGVYLFVLLSIPIGAYLASQNQVIKSRASEQKPTKPPIQTPAKTITNPAKELLTATESDSGQEASDAANPEDSSPTIASAFGPTLALKVALQGRPRGNYTTKLFIGIVEGTLTVNPKFLLSFSVDLPASGEYSNLSLAGLTQGTAYTALLKGSTQIATSSAFTVTPTVTNLNGGEPLTLTTGDLNEDNVINSADYSIVKKVLGTTIGSGNWNESADFNQDGIINTFDLSLITKNMGQAGASGAWTSPIPKTATSSAALTQPSTGGPLGSSGHWIWVPNL